MARFKDGETLQDAFVSLAAALEAALPYLKDAAEPLSGYGFFPGGDPRNFFPDGEACDPEVIKRHKEDCEKFERGEIGIQPSSGQWYQIGDATVHILHGTYGMGGYTYQDEKALEVYEQAKAALRVVKEAENAS